MATFNQTYTMQWRLGLSPKCPASRPSLNTALTALLSQHLRCGGALTSCSRLRYMSPKCADNSARDAKHHSRPLAGSALQTSVSLSLHSVGSCPGRLLQACGTSNLQEQATSRPDSTDVCRIHKPPLPGATGSDVLPWVSGLAQGPLPVVYRSWETSFPS